MAILTPDYINIDFTTVIQRIKDQLANSDTFRDYNFEGANFTVLMELMAYISEMNVYMQNKVAKNIHIETADIYEAVNRNARQMGYEPKGPISSRGTVSVTVTGATPGNEYRISEFMQLESTETDADGDAIKFANTTLYSVTPTGASFNFDISVRQGEIIELTGYTGGDLIDNELILPANYAYDNDLDDDYPSLEVVIGGVEWSRVSDFYDELSPLLSLNTVYQFIYDRYERSKLVFSSSRSVPTNDDVIAIKVLNTLGEDGNVGINTITIPPTQFLYNVTAASWVNNADITITNPAEATGSANAEDVDIIKENAKAGLHAQFRNVTAADYISHLEQRSDVIVAAAWGEQDLAPSGDVLEFNRVHLSTIPDEWTASTIATTPSSWTPSWGTSGAIMIPSGYSNTWETALKNYVEPRKMISAYEVFELPDPVYLSFDFGVRKKRLANLAEIQEDLTNKLDYYFRAQNQEFNSEINFNDILEYLLDTTNVSPTDNFESIAQIRNLNLRDIDVNKPIKEPGKLNFPQYVEASTVYTGENQLRKIQLGLDQFPILHVDSILISEET
jgi:hypothetical protein